MGAWAGFADVLCAKLADVPPPVARGGLEASRIASPAWVHRLEPLRAVSAPFLHSRYPSAASAAPEAGGIPVGNMPSSSCGGSTARLPRPVVRRTAREQLALRLLTRLGANLTAASTDDEVRREYRRLLLASHPDVHPDASPAERDAHARKVRAIVHAWNVFQGRNRTADAA